MQLNWLSEYKSKIIKRLFNIGTQLEVGQKEFLIRKLFQERKNTEIEK